MSKNKIDFDRLTPLYEQVIEDLRRKIENGEFKPGDQIGTQSDLAAQYNVSLITIKNAVSSLAREGLLSSRAGRGTFVSERPVRRIDLKDHKLIGLVLRDLKHPYFSMIVHSVEEQAYKLGYQILLTSSSGSFDKEEGQIERFRRMGADGLIIASLSLEYRATEYIQRLHRENVPYVMVSYIHDPEYWYVGSDHEQGGYLATEHLIRLGYQSIGYVHLGQTNLLSEVRKNGYYRALVDYNVPYLSDYLYDVSTIQEAPDTDRFQLGVQFGKEFMGIKRKKAEALFFYNDMIALGFIQSVTEQGMKVPEDVAIVGFDDAVVSRFASVPLTTVHQPVDRIGHLAVEIIKKRIEKSDIGNRNVLKPSLIIRESCGASQRRKQVS